MVCRTRTAIRPLVALQKHPRHPQGAPRNPTQPRGESRGRGRHRQRHPRRVREVSGSRQKPWHLRKGFGFGQRKLPHDAQPLRQRVGSAHRHARRLQQQALRRVGMGQRENRHRLLLPQPQLFNRKTLSHEKENQENRRQHHRRRLVINRYRVGLRPILAYHEDHLYQQCPSLSTHCARQQQGSWLHQGDSFRRVPARQERRHFGID